MQKFLRFLETNVEWFALCIAVLFLGWTAFTYLISQPVTRVFAEQQVTPGDIDKVIDAGPAQNLRDQMNSAQAPSFAVEDFASAVTRGLALESESNVSELADNFDWQPFDLGKFTDNNTSLQTQVKQLPTLPAAQPLLVATGLDTIVPGLPPGVNPQAGAAGKDVDLTVAAFTIPWQPLSDQWNKAFGPDQAGGEPKLRDADFEILAVVAYRSEKLPDGTWSSETEVPSQISGFPPYPAAGDKNAETNYETAVTKQPALVVAPPIPAAIAGAAWRDPLVLWQDQVKASPPSAAAGQSPEGQAAPSGNPFLVDVANRGSRGGGNGTNYNNANPNQTQTQTSPSRLRGPLPPDSTTVLPGTNAPVAPAAGTVTPIIQTVANAAAAALLPVEPIAKIDPVGMPAKSPDLCVYIVDDTTQSGKTYKYRIEYKALNPLFNKAPQKALVQTWVDQFDLVSPRSDATPEITVPVKTYLYCGSTQGIARKPQYPFEVITWANGQWRSDTFQVNPGDPIGGVDNGIDYSTGWSYADGRPKADAFDNLKFMITLVDNENGNALIRDAQQDMNTADYKLKHAWVEQGKPGAEQPNPAAPAPTAPAGNPHYAPHYGVPGFMGGAP